MRDTTFNTEHCRYRWGWSSRKLFFIFQTFSHQQAFVVDVINYCNLLCPQLLTYSCGSSQALATLQREYQGPVCVSCAAVCSVSWHSATQSPRCARRSQPVLDISASVFRSVCLPGQLGQWTRLETRTCSFPGRPMLEEITSEWIPAPGWRCGFGGKRRKVGLISISSIWRDCHHRPSMKARTTDQVRLGCSVRYFLCC